jgi:hypothetical protein
MFLSIVDLAGHMLPLQLSLIESRSREILLGPISTLLHRFSFLANLKTMGAMEVNQSMLMNGCTTTTSQMKLAPSTQLEVTIMDTSALISLCAETAILTNLATFLTNIWSTELMSSLTSQERKT